MPNTTGSLAVIEEFFGESISERTPDTVLSLPAYQAQELLDRLQELDVPLSWVRPDGVPVGTVSPVVERGFAPTGICSLFSIYFQSVAVPDPGLLHLVSSDRRSQLLGLASGLSALVSLRPLIACGTLVMYPPTMLTLVWGDEIVAMIEDQHVRDRLVLPEDDIELASALSKRMANWAARNMTLDDAIIWSVLAVSKVVAGIRMNTDLVPFSKVPGLIDVIAPKTARGLRVSALQRVALPSFHDLSPALAAQVRQDSDAAAAVRDTLTSALTTIPDFDDETGRDAALDAFAENLRDAARRLSKEVRRRPSLEAATGSALALGGGVVQAVAAGGFTGGAGYAGASAPIPLLVSWLRARRTTSVARTASRLLLELVPEQ